MVLFHRKETQGPSARGADEGQASTCQNLPDFSCSIVPCFQEAPQCHNVLIASAVSQWPLASMRPCRVTMALWFCGAPQCHNGFHDSLGPCNATMVSMDPRCPAGSQRPCGCTRPCNAAMASWFHRALLLHTGPLGPCSPAVPQ